MGKRYALLIMTTVYTGVLVLLHMAGLFPRPGLYDVSRLAGTPRVTLEGQVLHFPMTRWGRTRFLLEGRAQPQTAFRGRMVVQLEFPAPDIEPGDRLRLRGWLSRPRAPASSAVFDERAYWAGFRAYSVLHVADIEQLQLIAHAPDWSRLAWRFHQAFEQFWFERLPEDEAALLSCIAIGSRGILSQDIKRDCIRAGVYHILVVSGQKMALLIALSIGALRGLHVPRRRALWICGPLVFFYAAAVGADPPVLRAAAMAMAGLAALALGRDPPTYCPFLLAWLGVLIGEPEALFGASFQLSFGATASLLCFLPMIRRLSGVRNRAARWVLEAAGVSLAVNLGVWPVLIYYFHQLSLAGVVANWTLFPFSGVLTVLGLGLGTLGTLCPGIIPSILLGMMHHLMSRTLQAICWMSGWRWAAIVLPRLSFTVLAVYYALLICILWKLHGFPESTRQKEGRRRL